MEQTFRTAKDLLATRPIYHQTDETIRGHVFCSFLALVLKELEDRLAAARLKPEWRELLADLEPAARNRGRRRTASASSFAPRYVPPRASLCAPPASPCRRPCARRPPTDLQPKM